MRPNIEKCQSSREGVGIIYSGTVEHLLGVTLRNGYNNWWHSWEPSNYHDVCRKKTKGDRYADFKHIVRRFFDELIANPDDFLDTYGINCRDIYSAKELNDYFCDWHKVDGDYKCMLSELCPHEYFAAQGETLNVKVKGKILFFHKGIALRDASKWTGESAANCRNHIRDSMVNRETTDMVE